MLSGVKLTNAHTVRGRPALKNNTECFRNGLVRANSKKNKGNYQEIQLHQILMDPIDAMTNRNMIGVYL